MPAVAALRQPVLEGALSVRVRCMYIVVHHYWISLSIHCTNGCPEHRLCQMAGQMAGGRGAAPQRTARRGATSHRADTPTNTATLALQRLAEASSRLRPHGFEASRVQVRYAALSSARRAGSAARVRMFR